MSNKPSKLKSSKDIQIGNFIISKYGTELQYIKVKTTSGNWSETYRSDTDQFKLLDEALNDKEEHVEKYLHTLFTIHYIVCYGFKDYQFMQDVIEANQRFSERSNKDAKVITPEEDQQIINEEKEKYENGHN